MTTSAELTSSRGTARDTLTLGGWTAVSRATGVLRIVVVGAVLGPTFFGNTYQLTNSLPNLIYYGFLAGSLFSSLLVPALVRHIDNGEPRESARVSGGFLGVTLLALAVVAPIAVVLLPELLRLTGPLHAGRFNGEQVQTARVLVVMMVPQVFLYAVVGASTAVMYAHRRFALAAAAPALENLGIMAVLGVVALRYGTDHDRVAGSTGGLLLLGLGSTAAVALHASLQWWGARRTGVVLVPRAGWRDPEVRRVIRRALRSVLQAALLAVQLLTLLLVANRVAGGTVALQIAFNFYYLPIALVATPVALALLPRLARLHRDGAETEFVDTFREGLALGLFLLLPGAAGYVLLARPLAHVVAVGRMDDPGALSMVAGSLAVLALGLAAEGSFFVMTQAFYSRADTRTPLVSMTVQTGVCLVLCLLATQVGPGRVLLAVAGSYAAAAWVGALLLFGRTRAGWGSGHTRIWPSLLRTGVGVAVMAAPVWFVTGALTGGTAPRWAWAGALLLATAVGLLLFLATAAVLRAPELSWLTAALRRSAPEPVAAHQPAPEVAG
ncbi:MAG: murein biosynthesis integral membrane protein MurJ [Nocardioidaceae bacterium]